MKPGLSLSNSYRIILLGVSKGRATLLVFVIVTVFSLGLTTTAGGTSIPINTTELLFTGEQSISMWMIPVVIAGAGIGIFVIKRRN